MKKVYCVYDGDYCSQTLREIFSTRKLAEEYVKYCGSSYAIIIERDIDCSINKEEKTYYVEFGIFANCDFPEFIETNIEELDNSLKEPYVRVSGDVYIELNSTNKEDVINKAQLIANKLSKNKLFMKKYNNDEEFYCPVSKFLN